MWKFMLNGFQQQFEYQFMKLGERSGGNPKPYRNIYENINKWYKSHVIWKSDDVAFTQVLLINTKSNEQYSNKVPKNVFFSFYIQDKTNMYT